MNNLKQIFKQTMDAKKYLIGIMCILFIDWLLYYRCVVVIQSRGLTIRRDKDITKIADIKSIQTVGKILFKKKKKFHKKNRKIMNCLMKFIFRSHNGGQNAKTYSNKST